MGERPGTAAMPSANASRKHSAESRRSPGKRSPGSVAVIASDGLFTFAAAAYNLVRLPKLIAEAC
jgi:hypothetical protein